TTPRTDTNGDGLVDVGQVPGLSSQSFFVQVVVPADASSNTIDLTTVVASSVLDPSATASSRIVLEYYGPGPSDWPTFHNTNSRRGSSPNVFAPPMTQLYSATGNLASMFTSPVYAGGMLFSVTLDETVRARDPFSGDVIWSRFVGDGWVVEYFTGAPAYTCGELVVVTSWVVR